MKYLIKEEFDSCVVRLSGEEEEQTLVSNLAANIFNTPCVDTYAGKVLTFESKKQFKNFLFWRSIFNNCSPNTQFHFLSFARKAVEDLRNIFKTDVVCLDSFS